MTERYKLLVVEDEQEARDLVADINEDGRKFIANASKLCREKYPDRKHCECFPCSIYRWM